MNQSTEICNKLYAFAKEKNGENLWMIINDIPIFVIQNHDDADWVLRRNVANYPKKMEWFRQVLGASRFSEDGHEWKIRKELSQPYFNKFDRERAYQLACKYSEKTLETLTAIQSTRISDNIFRNLTFSVLVENFFNLALDDINLDTDALSSLMSYASEYSFIPADKTSLLYKEQLAKLPALRRKLLEDFQLFRTEKVLPNPMLEGIIAADQDPDNSIILEHELLTFFAAGAETTACAIGWACYLLAKHPDIQELLRHDVDTLFQSGKNHWTEATQLTNLTAFISETLRLYPPTPITTRTAIEKDQIGHEIMAPGQQILISFVGTQHDERYYATPWALNMTEGRDSPHTKARAGINSAFGVGPRVCGGKHFALTELTGVLVTFLRYGTLTLTCDEAPVFYWKSQMLHKNGQPVSFRKRSL